MSTVTKENATVSNSSSIEARINSMIKEFFEYKEIDKKFENELRSWRHQNQKLSANNFSKEDRYNNLQTRIKLLKENISKYMTTDQTQKQELTELLMQRAKKEQKDWDHFQSEISIYDKNFPRAQVEYSIQNLMEDIERYRRESKNVHDEITNIKRELTDLIIQYNLNNLEVSADFNGLSDSIRSTKFKNSSMLQEIGSANDTRQAVQNKLKRSETILHEHKNKEKDIFFRTSVSKN